ncbi:MAG: hypothetical protein M1812_003705 [Candelaria pacifica]|nr:MAG: hypothetical protein M1812_003705 [Candelaria pacifica]
MGKATKNKESYSVSPYNLEKIRQGVGGLRLNSKLSAAPRRPKTDTEVPPESGILPPNVDTGPIFGSADKAGVRELNRANFYHNIDPNHNFDKFFSLTKARLSRIRARINVGLPLDPLDSAYVDACCEREKSPNRFEARDKYIWMWQNQEETANHWSKTTTKKINRARNKLEKTGLKPLMATIEAEEDIEKARN